jgi:hypothetical protein
MRGLEIVCRMWLTWQVFILMTVIDTTKNFFYQRPLPPNNVLLLEKGESAARRCPRAHQHGA